MRQGNRKTIDNVTRCVTLRNVVSVRRLVWDEWNVTHIARHGITPDEVEQVCRGNPVRLQSYKKRIILVGPTQEGKIISVVLDPENHGVYYPVTARLASRKERRYWEQERGGEN